MKSKRATLWQEDEHRDAGQRVPRPQPLPQPHAVPVSLLCLPWGSPPWTWPQTVGPSIQASPFSSSSSSVSTERAFTVREIQLIHSKKSIFSPDLLSFTAQIACRANDQNQQFFDLNVKISCWRPVLRGWSECVGGGDGGQSGIFSVFVWVLSCQSILIVWSLLLLPSCWGTNLRCSFNSARLRVNLHRGSARPPLTNRPLISLFQISVRFYHFMGSLSAHLWLISRHFTILLFRKVSGLKWFR